MIWTALAVTIVLIIALRIYLATPEQQIQLIVKELTVIITMIVIYKLFKHQIRKTLIAIQFKINEIKWRRKNDKLI